MRRGNGINRQHTVNNPCNDFEVHVPLQGVIESAVERPRLKRDSLTGFKAW